MTITLIGYYGYKNYGDDLMLYSLIKNLLKNRGVNINVLVKNQAPDFLLNESRINVFVFNNNSKILNIKIFFDSIRNSSMLIWGGGTCFTNEDGVSIRYFLLAKLLAKKIGYLGIGIGALTGFKKYKAQFILNIADIITSRDIESYRSISKLLFFTQKRKHDLTSDLSYLLEYNVTSVKDDYILVSLHNLNRYLNETQINERRKYIYDFLVKNIERNIKILPLCDADIPENKLLYIELKKVSSKIDLLTTVDFEERTKIIESASFYYTERLHGFIVSYFVNTICVPLKYSNKFDAFINSEEICVNSIKLSRVELISSIAIEKNEIIVTNKKNRERAKHNIQRVINLMNIDV